MKSRISYFDKTVFKKDLTRFAPSWGFYTICLYLGMVLLRQEGGSAFGFHRALDQLPQVMVLINFCYAFLNVQLLWGDLYNSRLCNALHALPLRRETWFVTHTLSGLTYSLLPTLLVTPFALLLGIGSMVESGWQLIFWWLLSTNLQYLFFFGLGTFCAFCVGNRLAQAVVYGITNFASVIAFWLVDTLYTPLLFGLQTAEDPFLIASPCVWMTSLNYVSVERLYDNELHETIRAWYELGEGWGYTALCAVLGAALLGAGCLLYRKRKLECAGDFVAIKVLEPVFLVIFPLVSGALVHFFCDDLIYTGDGTAIIFLFVGIILGFFAAKMLLERSIRVFGKKAFLQLAVFCAVFGSTLLVTWLDPLGLVTWIPEQAEVASVEVFPNHYDYNGILLETPEEIEDALKVHRWALDNQDYTYSGYDFEMATAELLGEEIQRTHNPQHISLSYHLTDGTTRTRYYTVDLMQLPGELLIPHFSSMDAVFSAFEGEHTVSALAARIKVITVRDSVITDPTEIRELLEAIEADCEAGRMAQNYNFRPEPDVGASYYLDFAIGEDFESGAMIGESITIYTDCHNTNNWLMEHGITSKVLEEMAKYGIVHGTP